MLMSKVLAGIMVIAVLFGAFSGRIEQVSQAGISGAGEAVQLVISVCGTICLWSAIMEVMERSGLGAAVGRLLRPLIVLIYGKYGRDQKAVEAISQNMAANLLGLGSAATPAGLRAASRLHQLAQKWNEPPDAVILLIITNSASIQLLPTTVAAVRAGLGSASPYDILPAVWVSSVVSVTVGILAAKLLREVWSKRDGVHSSGGHGVHYRPWLGKGSKYISGHDRRG